MTKPILVTGGTGNIGSRVVRMLREADREVRILTRRPHSNSPGVDYVSGDTVKNRALAEAVAGVDTIIHLAGGPRGDEVAAANLVAAAQGAGVEHVVLISVIGADRMPIGYFRRKAEAEGIVMGSGMPWTILRAAQLHDFVLPIVRTLSTLRVVPRDLRFEPVDGDQVAARLTALALGEPSGHVPDIAGPHVEEARDLVKTYNQAQGRRRPLLTVPLIGVIGRAYRSGANLGDASTMRGSLSWEEYLMRQTGALLAGRD
ncbi:SDR family oxidoreductase [Brevibacterium sp.]|uniref:SDR family oxidoreductase n=1 Tax=Brevibacterium sp. TaxID=1701 RepID=UPI002810A694|nr:SDR family oxidoreductase [Brevibacterium sp.]